MIVGIAGTLASVGAQVSALLTLAPSDRQSAPVIIAFGAIGVWMVISNQLARVERTLPSGLAWLGVVAGVGLIVAAVVLGLQGFRTSDPAALPTSDPGLAAGLALSVLAHVASLTWAIWLGRALGAAGAPLRAS